MADFNILTPDWKNTAREAPTDVANHYKSLLGPGVWIDGCPLNPTVVVIEESGKVFCIYEPSEELLTRLGEPSILTVISKTSIKTPSLN